MYGDDDQESRQRSGETSRGMAGRAYPLAAFLALCLAMRRPTPKTFFWRFFFSLICFREPSRFFSRPTLASLYLGSNFLASSMES